MVAHFGDNAPSPRVGGLAMGADAGETDVIDFFTDGDVAQEGQIGRVDPAQHLGGDPAAADVDDFPDGVRCLQSAGAVRGRRQAQDALGKLDGVRQVGGGPAWLQRVEGFPESGPIGGEALNDHRVRIALNQQHGIVGGQGVEESGCPLASPVEQDAALPFPVCRAHPGGGLEDHDVMARGAARSAEAKVRDRQQQQERRQKLQQQRPGLLQTPAARRHQVHRPPRPETQSRDDAAAAGAVVEIQGDDRRADGNGERQQFGQCETQQFHGPRLSPTAGSKSP